jgi:hypothetical protein
MKKELFSHVRDEKGIPFATIAFVTDQKSGMFDVGIAVCSPEDHFVKKIGREKALERAKRKQTKYNVPADKQEMIEQKLLNLMGMMYEYDYFCESIELGQNFECIYPWVGRIYTDYSFSWLYPRKVIFTEKDIAVVLDETDFEGRKMSLQENLYKFLYNV